MVFIVARAGVQVQLRVMEQLQQHMPRLQSLTGWKVSCLRRQWSQKVQASTKVGSDLEGNRGTEPEVEEAVENWEAPCIQKLYEDDLVIAIAKPGTLLVHNNKAATWEEKQRNAFAKDLVEAQHTLGKRVNPVHRLDRAASGVMLFAKSGAAARAAQAALSHSTAIKEYVVLARGCTPDSFICDDPVKDDKGILRPAITECEKLLDLPQARCSLLKVVIKTGRWHQIRKHLNHRASHVVGDVRHGKGGTNRYFRDHYNMPSGRIFLHASCLTFPYHQFLSVLTNQTSESNHSQHTWGVASPRVDCSHENSWGVDSLVSSTTPALLTREGDVEALEEMRSRAWMASGVSFNPDAKTGLQLTIRAMLPEDLQQVLLAVPDNLSKETLLSLGLLL